MKKVRFANDWGEAFSFLKYKITHPSPRIASLGMMTAEEARVKLMHNQYNQVVVTRALQELAKLGEIDVYYVSREATHREENYATRETWRRIEAGELFNKRTGQPYTSTFVTKYACTQARLALAEEGAPAPLTILGRIREALRGLW
jgi:hypothetical protein